MGKLRRLPETDGARRVNVWVEQRWHELALWRLEVDKPGTAQDRKDRISGKSGGGRGVQR